MPSRRSSYPITRDIRTRFLPTVLLLLALIVPAFSQETSSTTGLVRTADAVTNIPPGTVSLLVPPEVTPPIPEPQLPIPGLATTVPTGEVPREIRATEDGAIADFGRSTVLFAADSAAAPAVTVLTADGKRLSFAATFLVLANRATGENFLIASVTNSAGQITKASEVTYPNAFDSLAADLKYEYDWERNSVEQFVVLHENPALLLPESWAASDVRLECWTEWFEGQETAVKGGSDRLRQAANGVSAVDEPDTEIDFGASRILRKGEAFSLPTDGESVRVCKNWITEESQTAQRAGMAASTGRRFLVETVDLLAAKGQLDKLAKPRKYAASGSFKGHDALFAARSSGSLIAKAAQPRSTLASAPTPAGQESFVIDFCLQGCYPVPSGLVSWWGAEGNALDGNYGNNGTVNGVVYASGKVGQAFSFNGTGAYISVPNASTLNFGANANFSIEAWIKPETAATDYGVQTIVDKRYAPSSSQALGYALYLVGGKLGFQLAQSPGNAYGFTSYGPVGTDLRSDGQWHHIAVSLSRNATNGLKFYVDGVPQGTNNPTSQAGDLSNTQPFLIGKHALSSLNAGFKGLIDELTVYSRALGASEVLSIYQAGAAGKCDQCCSCYSRPANVVGWWPGDGSTLDLGRGHPVTLLNGATYGPATVRQGFSFPGTGAAQAKILSTPDLDIGPTGTGLTIEAWINPVDNTARPLVSWCNATTTGAHLWQNFPAAGCLYADFLDTSGVTHNVTVNSALAPNVPTHVAATYGKQSGVLKLYVNGVVRGQYTWGNFTPRTALDFYLGHWPSSGLSLNSILDEPTIYDRELSATEISSIWAAGASGKCKGPPTVTSQPQSEVVAATGPTSFSVVASGSPLTYQWLKNGTAISGATSSSFTIANAQGSDAAFYTVQISNGAGTTLSEQAILAVMTAQPVSQSVFIGATALFSVTVASPVSPTYQWWKGAAALAGATGSSYSKSAVLPADADTYTVHVTVPGITGSSQPATLTVLTGAPQITSQPIDQTILVSDLLSDNVTFRVEASGVEPLSYQWTFTGADNQPTPLPQGTGPSLTLDHAGSDQAGTYSVTVTGSGGSGSTTSRQATLTVGNGSPYAVVLTGTRQDYRFNGTVTYLVDSEVHFVGNTTLEGGTVVKYTKSPGASLVFDGPVSCETGPYQPFICTAEEDDSVGWTISDSPGQGAVSGYYADVALDVRSAQNTLLHDLRISFAETAVRYSGAISDQVTDSAKHVAIMNCSTGFKTEGNTSATPYKLRMLQLGNVLIGNARPGYRTATAFAGSSFGGVVEHLTVSHCSTLVTDSISDAPALSIKNSILADVTNQGQPNKLTTSLHNGFFMVDPQFGTDPLLETQIPFAPTVFEDPPGSTEWYPFLVNGQGCYYLRSESPFVDAGTDSIDPDLKADFGCRTTAVPSPVFFDDINSSQTIGPTAIRDSNMPDLGWHYPVVDYIVNRATVNNCTLNIDQGTVLAFEGVIAGAVPPEEWNLPLEQWGIRLNAGGRLNVNGVPTNRVVFARLEAVQESTLCDLTSDGPMLHFRTVFFGNGDIPATPLAEAALRYADFHTISSELGNLHLSPLLVNGSFLMPDCAKHGCFGKLAFEGCAFQGGSFLCEDGGPVGRSLGITNCVFERVDVREIDSGNYTEHTHATAHGTQVTAVNNLFYRCGLMLWPVPEVPAPTWVFADNIFDNCGFYYDASATYNGPVSVNHHNAYVGMLGAHLSPAQNASSDPDLPALAYQSGPLGRFYLPQAATQLVNQGSRSASAAGLYHFTTSINNDKEAGTQVDIGPHHLALDSAGGASDWNQDGIPDFIADRNGDGNETMEIPWASVNTSSPLILSPAPGSTLSGIAKIYVDLGQNASGLDSVTLLIDGCSAWETLGVPTPARSSSLLELDTRFLKNGPHNISIQTHGSDPAQPDDPLTVGSPGVPINVANDYSLVQWNNRAELSVYVDIETSASLASGRVHFFRADYPKAKEPSRALAPIDVTINAGQLSLAETPANLSVETSPDIYTFTEPGSESPTGAWSNPVIYNDSEDCYPEVGLWVTTYAEDPVDYFRSKDEPKLDVLAWAGGPRWCHDIMLYEGWYMSGLLATAGEQPSLVAFPSANPSVGQTWPVRTLSGQLTADKKALMNFLAQSNVRNMYGYGHGSAWTLMGIARHEFEDAVRNRRFRFVWFDGCETATGGGKPLFATFGAHKREIETAKTYMQIYQSGSGPVKGPLLRDDYKPKDAQHPIGLGIRPSLFMGWLSTKITGHRFNPKQQDPSTGRMCSLDNYPAMCHFESQFNYYWRLRGFTALEAFKAAVSEAAQPSSEPPWDIHKDVEIDSSGTEVPFYPHYCMSIVGFGEMTFNEVNHAGDGW